jgi:hypothetical protein
MGSYFTNILNKVPSIGITDIKTIRVPKLLVIVWLGALLLIWVIASIFGTKVAAIDWTVLVLIAMLLGANIGLNFGGGEPTNSMLQNTGNILSGQASPLINQPPVHPDLAPQKPGSEKD